MFLYDDSLALIELLLKLSPEYRETVLKEVIHYFDTLNEAEEEN